MNTNVRIICVVALLYIFDINCNIVSNRKHSHCNTNLYGFVTHGRNATSFNPRKNVQLFSDVNTQSDNNININHTDADKYTTAPFEHFKSFYLFHVAHKFKKNRGLLDYISPPKQKLLTKHINDYYNNSFEEINNRINDLVYNFEYQNEKDSEINTASVKGLLDRIYSVFIRYYYDNVRSTDTLYNASFQGPDADTEQGGTGHIEAVSRDILHYRKLELLYNIDLFASYILLFVKPNIKRLLYNHVWKNYCLLDGNVNYLCCDWVLNNNVHDADAHKKFNQLKNCLTRKNAISLIRYNKKSLSFIKNKSQTLLQKLSNSSLYGLLQTILTRLLYSTNSNIYNYIHKFLNKSKDNIIKLSSMKLYEVEVDDKKYSIYGFINSNIRFSKDSRLAFLNNLFNYNRFELLDLLIAHLSAMPELLQIHDETAYLSYINLNKLTLAKLLYVALIRTNNNFVETINDHYLGLDDPRLKEDGFFVDQTEDVSYLIDDLLVFANSEVEDVLDHDYYFNNVAKNIRHINEKLVNTRNILLGCRRDKNVVTSILKHKPHINILTKLLEDNDHYGNTVIRHYAKAIRKLTNSGRLDIDTYIHNNIERAASRDEILDIIVVQKYVNIILDTLNKINKLNHIYSQFQTFVYPDKSRLPPETSAEAGTSEEGSGDQLEAGLDEFEDESQKLVDEITDIIGDDDVEVRFGDEATNTTPATSPFESVVNFIKGIFSVGDEYTAKHNKTVPASAKDDKIRSIVFEGNPEDPENKDEVMEYFDEKVEEIENSKNTIKIHLNPDSESSKVFTSISGPNKGYRTSRLFCNMSDHPYPYETSTQTPETQTFDTVDKNRLYWRHLGLKDNVIDALLGYLNAESQTQDAAGGATFETDRMYRPSLIQILSIPEILKQNNTRNLTICSAAGSGKTLSYLLPIFQVLKEDERLKLRERSAPRAMILAPTSELCEQITKTIKHFSHALKLSCVSLSKYASKKVIKSKLEGLVDIVVSTPRRILRYAKTIKFNRLKYLVLDEADKLLVDNFFPQVYSVLNRVYNTSAARTSGSRENCSVYIYQVANNLGYLNKFKMAHDNFVKYIRKYDLMGKGDPADERSENGIYYINVDKLYNKNVPNNQELIKYYIFDKQVNKVDGRNNFLYNHNIVANLINAHQIVDSSNIFRPNRNVRHVFLRHTYEDKMAKLVNLLKYQLKFPTKADLRPGSSWHQDPSNARNRHDRPILIFVRDIKSLHFLEYYLTELGYDAFSLHHDLPLELRKENYQKLLNGNSFIMITTNLLNSGLNLTNIGTIILFDFVRHTQEYINKASLLMHRPVDIFAEFLRQVNGASAAHPKPEKKTIINFVSNRNKHLYSALYRSMCVNHFPLNKLSNNKNDYDIIHGRLKYLTQSGGYFKFLKHLRKLKVENTFDDADFYKYLDDFRAIVKTQFKNSMKKVKLRRLKICKRRRKLMRVLKLLKKNVKIIRLNTRIISDMRRKKYVLKKDYIYNEPPNKIKNKKYNINTFRSRIKKVRFKLLQLKLLKHCNSERLLKLTTKNTLKFINKLQMRLVENKKLVDRVIQDYSNYFTEVLKERNMAPLGEENAVGTAKQLVPNTQEVLVG